MAEHKLIAGHIVTIFNGRERTPTDEAVIHIEGDEDSEIEIHCPNAPILAAKIVKAVNSHDALVKALTDILEANKDFRDGMPQSWDGDPLQDACDAAAKLINRPVGGAL